MPSIESSRLVLRDYLQDGSEIESVLSFTADPEVARHSSWGPLSRVETSEFLQEAVAAGLTSPRASYNLAIIVQSSGELIGNASIHIRNAKTREAEIGYTIRRDSWNLGYATEVAQAMTGFGFIELKLHRLIATTSPENFASQKVLEKVGFTKEGYLRKNVLQRGQWRDSFLYALLEEDYHQHKGSN